MKKEQSENLVCSNSLQLSGLRLEQLIQKLGLKKATIYAYMKRGLLPKPVKFGRASVWIESEVNHALEIRMKARGK